MTSTTKKLYISDVANELGRVPHTIRVWQYQNRLPEHLLPHRDERGWRYWTREQVDGIKQWVIDEDIRPGKALRNARKRES